MNKFRFTKGAVLVMLMTQACGEPNPAPIPGPLNDPGILLSPHLAFVEVEVLGTSPWQRTPNSYTTITGNEFTVRVLGVRTPRVQTAFDDNASFNLTEGTVLRVVDEVSASNHGRVTNIGSMDGRPGFARLDQGSHRLIVLGRGASSPTFEYYAIGYSWAVDSVSGLLQEPAMGYPAGTSVDSILDISEYCGGDSGVACPGGAT